jgi:hypothetical protein
MAQISILNNPPSNGNCKTWKERKQKKLTCWSVSPFLLCLRCSVNVLCTIHRCPPPFNTYIWWCQFSMNKRDANVGSWSSINCLTMWTTSFYSRRLALKKTLTSSSFVSLNLERTMHKFRLCTFHWKG